MWPQLPAAGFASMGTGLGSAGRVWGAQEGAQVGLGWLEGFGMIRRVWDDQEGAQLDLG